MRVTDIVRLVGGILHGDTRTEIQAVAALELAGPTDLSFAENPRSLEQASESRAGCILIPEAASLPGRTTIAVANPKLALIRVAEALHPPHPRSPGIHPTALIDPQAVLAAEVTVGPYVVIEQDSKVGERTRLDAGVFLGKGVEIGSDCILYPRVSVYSGARIGNRVVLHAGVVIGSDGFGYVFAEGRHHKFPQLGEVVIEDDVEIGSNTTVDRGSLGTTLIGLGTKIDNLVQVAHNVRIGRHSVIAAQTGISGSVVIGDYVVLAGQVGVADRVRIEDHSVIGAQAGIPTGKIVRRGSTMWGTPARPLDHFKRMYASLSNLPGLAKQVKELSRSQKRMGRQPPGTGTTL